MKLITINHAAKDPRGMTVGEIEDFVRAVTDQDAPLKTGYIVQVEPTGDGTIRSLETTLALNDD